MCVICGVYVCCNCIEGISDGVWGLEVGVGNQLQLLFHLFYWGRVSVKFRTNHFLWGSLPVLELQVAGSLCPFNSYVYSRAFTPFFLPFTAWQLLFFLPLLFGAILDVCLHGIIFPFLSGLFHFVLKVYHIITCMRILSLSWDHMMYAAFIFQFICWWASGLSLPFGHCE